MGGSAIIDGKEYKCMDNFYECTFVIDKLKYCSSENYFQSAKATNREDHEKVRQMGLYIHNVKARVMGVI